MNAFGILASMFRVLLATMVQKSKVVRDIVFTYVVLHNMMRTYQGGVDKTPTLADDIVALQNGQIEYVNNDNFWNLSREAKHQLDPLKDGASIILVHWLGRWTGSEKGQITTLGTEAGIYQFYSGLPNYSKSFYLS